jgi:vitamin K-dependent gamma-carboxylase
MQWINQLKSTIFQGATDSRVLSLFRILFGFWMFVDALLYYKLDYINKGLLAPHMHFKYEGFEWWPLFPPLVLHALMALKLILPVFILLGIRVRITALLFAFIEIYFLLLDKAYFNNHIYLYALFGMLLALTKSDDTFALFKKQSTGLIPAWHIWHFRILISVAYFFTGVVKFKADWLFKQEPVRTMVASFPETHLFHGVLNNEPIIYLMTVGGFLIDIMAPLWLLYKPVRKYMIWAYAGFHTMNSILFDDIGVFPFVMLSTLILFYDANELFFFRQKTAQKSKKQSVQGNLVTTSVAMAKPWVIGISMVWFSFHILFPLRFIVLPNMVDFTTIGNRFSWRVKADNRDIEEFAIYVTNKDSGQKFPVYFHTYLNEMQILHLWHDPRSLVQFARFMEEEVKQNHNMSRVKVTAEIKFKYNGRDPMYFIDPEVDLTRVDISPFKKLEWVNQDF